MRLYFSQIIVIKCNLTDIKFSIFVKTKFIRDQVLPYFIF